METHKESSWGQDLTQQSFRGTYQPLGRESKLNWDSIFFKELYCTVLSICIYCRILLKIYIHLLFNRCLGKWHWGNTWVCISFVNVSISLFDSVAKCSLEMKWTFSYHFDRVYINTNKQYFSLSSLPHLPPSLSFSLYIHTHTYIFVHKCA